MNNTRIGFVSGHRTFNARGFCQGHMLPTVLDFPNHPMSQGHPKCKSYLGQTCVCLLPWNLYKSSHEIILIIMLCQKTSGLISSSFTTIFGTTWEATPAATRRPDANSPYYFFNISATHECPFSSRCSAPTSLLSCSSKATTWASKFCTCPFLACTNRSLHVNEGHALFCFWCPCMCVCACKRTAVQCMRKHQTRQLQVFHTYANVKC